MRDAINLVRVNTSLFVVRVDCHGIVRDNTSQYNSNFITMEADTETTLTKPLCFREEKKGKDIKMLTDWLARRNGNAGGVISG